MRVMCKHSVSNTEKVEALAEEAEKRGEITANESQLLSR